MGPQDNQPTTDQRNAVMLNVVFHIASWLANPGEVILRVNRGVRSFPWVKVLSAPYVIVGLPALAVPRPWEPGVDWAMWDMTFAYALVVIYLARLLVEYAKAFKSRGVVSWYEGDPLFCNRFGFKAARRLEPLFVFLMGGLVAQVNMPLAVICISVSLGMGVKMALLEEAERQMGWNQNDAVLLATYAATGAQKQPGESVSQPAHIVEIHTPRRGRKGG